MNKEEYKAYLQTDEWQERKKYRLAVDGHTCQFCGTRGSALNRLNVHHFDYYALGEEDETALMNSTVTLCEICHAGIHRVMNRKTWDKAKRPEHGWADTLALTLHVFEGKTGESGIVYYDNGEGIRQEDLT